MKALIVALLFSSLASAAPLAPGYHYITGGGYPSPWAENGYDGHVELVWNGGNDRDSLTGSRFYMGRLWDAVQTSYDPIWYKLEEVNPTFNFEVVVENGLLQRFSFTSPYGGPPHYWYEGLEVDFGTGTWAHRVTETITLAGWLGDRPQSDIVPNPEPGTWLLMLTGFAAMAWRRRK